MAGLLREKNTIEIMITIYCRANHEPEDSICAECEELRSYALERIEKCPFADNKPKCSQCKIHCYKAVMRDRILAVMRFSGPRMIGKHPLLAISHVIDGFGSKPKL